MPELYATVCSRGSFVRRFVLFCFLLVFGLFAMASFAVAEERLIAVIIANDLPRYQHIHEAFVSNLKKVYGAEYRIYVQKPNADTMSLRNSARKSVAIGADLIVTYGAAATIAAQSESYKIPVLYAGVYNPVAQKTLSGKSLTGPYIGGVRGDGPVQTLLKVFTETAGIKKLAVVYDHKNPEGLLQYEALVEIALKRGFSLVDAVIEKLDNLPQILAALPDDLDGLFLANSEKPESLYQQVLNYAQQHDLPVVSQVPEMAEKGAFMVLEADPREQGEKLAVLASQVLSGEDFEQIPLVIPRQVSFVVNMNVAHHLNLKVPLQTLAAASRIVR